MQARRNRDFKPKMVRIFSHIIIINSFKIAIVRGIELDSVKNMLLRNTSSVSLNKSQKYYGPVLQTTSIRVCFISSKLQPCFSQQVRTPWKQRPLLATWDYSSWMTMKPSATVIMKHLKQDSLRGESVDTRAGEQQPLSFGSASGRCHVITHFKWLWI